MNLLRKAGDDSALSVSAHPGFLHPDNAVLLRPEVKQGLPAHKILKGLISVLSPPNSDPIDSAVLENIIVMMTQIMHAEQEKENIRIADEKAREEHQRLRMEAKKAAHVAAEKFESGIRDYIKASLHYDHSYVRAAEKGEKKFSYP